MEENASQGEYVEEVYFDEGKEGGFWARLEKFLDSRYFIALIVVLVSLVSFFLGVFWNARTQKEPLRVYNTPSQNLIFDRGEEKASYTSEDLKSNDAASAVLAPEVREGVVASKNGTKYHYPWCPGAKQISEKNKITFSSIEEARAKGYSPASNCKGLK